MFSGPDNPKSFTSPNHFGKVVRHWQTRFTAALTLLMITAVLSATAPAQTAAARQNSSGRPSATKISEENIVVAEPEFASSGILSNAYKSVADNVMSFTAADITVQSVGVTGGTPTAVDNDYLRISKAVDMATPGTTITLQGTFDWTESNAGNSWALGNDQTPNTLDDYAILGPNNLNNITITAATLDGVNGATILGPGDLTVLAGEGVFQFYSGGTNKNWTISNIIFKNFDNPILFLHNNGPIDEYSDTKLLNNEIYVAADDRADGQQTIGIHLSFGTNQEITGNKIFLNGDGVSDSANNSFAAEVGLQSNTSGGAVYDGLKIQNNIVRVLKAPSTNPERIRGIWENSHGHLSNITVSGNQFLNDGGAGNNPAANSQVGFRITSQSSATTTVSYANNRVDGANNGIQWLAGQNDFAGNQPVKLISNDITNNFVGVLVQSGGLGDLTFNRIAGNSTGINNVDGTATAENNFYGCNDGPEDNADCDPVVGTVTSNTFAVLDVSASPTTTANGGNPTITNGDSSTITAKFISSATGSTATLPFIDGIPIVFSGDVTTQTVPLMSGTATVNYVDASSNGDSTKTITGMVDNASDDATITVDDPSPTVQSITRNDSSPTMASSVNFTVTFSEPVTGATNGDFTVVRTGNLSGGAVTNVTAVNPDANGFTTTYTVTVSGYSTTNSNGTIGLSVPANSNIKDAAGQSSGAFTGGETYTILMTATANCPTGRQQAYDVASQFSLGSNPNCAYTYGNTSGATSNAVLTYQTPIVGAYNTSGIDGWYSAPFNSDGFPIPGIFKNNNNSPTSYLTIVQPAGSLALHPGKNGERSVLRFTVPTDGAGFYNLNGRFTGIDNGGTTTDVKILVTKTSGETTPFSGNITGFGNTAAFNFPINLAVGDTVDFSVGYGTNGNYGNDSTGLAATFTPIAAVTAEDLYGLSGTMAGAQQLVMLNSGNPSAATAVGGPITGLASGETLLGIDFRPATGQLYGLGSTSRLYTINITTGAATLIITPSTATPFTLDPNATQFGFDFNPTVDRIRVVSDTGQDLRLNPNNGALVSTDGMLAYRAANPGNPTATPPVPATPADPNFGTPPHVTAAAYTNSVSNATTTTLYDIDSALDILATQNPPNNGTLNTVGSTVADVPDANGFDISASSGLGYVSYNNQLYTIDLTTGKVSPVGAIGTFTNFTGLTAAPVDVAPIVRSINRVAGAQNPTNGSTVQFLVTFSEPVTGVDTTDFQINTTNGGQVGFVGQPVQQADPNTYIVTLSVGTVPAAGTDIRLDLIDDDTIKDAGGTPLGGVGMGNGSRTGDQIYSIDKTRPTITSFAAVTSPTDGQPVQFAVVFSEAVILEPTDVTINGSCVTGATTVTVNPTTASATNTISVIGLTVSNATQPCTVTAVIGTGMVVDTAGNTNAASATATATYAVPTVSIADASASETAGAISFDVTVTPASNVARTQTVTATVSTSDLVSPSAVGGTSCTTGVDYISKTQTLSFGTTDTTLPFTVTLCDDNISEPSEMFKATITGSTDSIVSSTNNTATGTITDNDGTPTVSIASPSLNPIPEGDNGATASNFTVSLSNPSSSAVTVTVKTGNDADPNTADATLGSDYSWGAINSSSFSNIALGANNPSLVGATQSSTAFGGVASRAIDGNRDSNFNGGSVSHTGILNSNGEDNDPNDTPLNGELQPYWDLNLGSSQPIDHLSIYNRTDCCSERLSRFYVFVSDAAFTGTSVVASQEQANVSTYFVSQIGSANVPTILRGIGRSGQYVRIQLDKTDSKYPQRNPNDPTDPIPAVGTFLSLAEVEVYSPIVDSQTVTIPAGAISAAVPFAVNGDTTFETDETLTATVTSAIGAAVPTTPPTATATIADNDSVPMAYIAPSSNNTIAEGSSQTFTVRLSNPTYQTVTINLNVGSNDPMLTSGDYTLSSNQLTFSPGDEAQEVTFTANADTLDEPDSEAFTITITSADANATTDPNNGGTATGTITDGDASAVTIGDVTKAEGKTGTTEFKFPISIGTTPRSTDTVLYVSTMDDTATAPEDYEALDNFPVTIPAGMTDTTVTVLVNGDTTVEPDETFNVMVCEGAGCTTPLRQKLGKRAVSVAPVPNYMAVGTIVNDDASLAFDNSAVTVAENVTGGTVTLTVNRTGAANAATVDYTVANGTATGGTSCTTGVDYITPTPNPGTLTFGVGDNSQDIVISVCDDSLFEGATAETFTVTLSNPQSTDTDPAVSESVTLGDDSTATVSITDNETAPTIVSVTQTIPGSETGPTPATFTVTLSGTSSTNTTVYVSTVNGTATASTTTPDDYTALNNQSVVVLAGQTTQTFDVTVNDDNVYEAASENFTVNASLTPNAASPDATTTGTIADNDTQPSVQFSTAAASVAENVTGGTVTLTVTRTGALGNAITVAYNTNGGTATGGASCTTGVDYITPSGTLLIPANAPSADITVTVCNDNLFETPNETIIATITAATNTSATSTAAILIGTPAAETVTITEDDTQPKLQFSSTTYAASDSAPNSVSINVTRTGATDNAVSVQYTVANGTATGGTSCTTGVDYIFPTPNPGTLNFAAGSNSQPFNVQVCGDSLIEGNETVSLMLSNPMGNATLGTPSTATLTISDGAAGGTLMISGTVTPANGVTNLNPGVSVTLSNGDTGAGMLTTMTDSNGKYMFTGLQSGSYLVTPSKSPYTFDPIERSVILGTTSVSGVDFTAYNSPIGRNLRIVNAYQQPSLASNVTVPIVLDSLGNENALSFSLNYDSTKLSNPVVACGSDAPGCTATPNTTGPAGTLGIAFDRDTPPNGPTVFTTGNGRQVVTVTFSTTPGTASNTQLTFGDNPVARDTNDVDGNSLATNYVSGFVVFAQGYEGDVGGRKTGNGILTSGDITVLRDFISGAATPDPNFNEFQRADCAPAGSKGNGILTSGDLTVLRNYSSTSPQTLVLAGGPGQSIASMMTNPFSASAKNLGSNADATAATGDVKVVDTATKRNTTVIVPITLDSNGTENGISFSIGFDKNKLSNPTVSFGSDVPLGDANNPALLTLNTSQVVTNGLLGITVNLPSGQTFNGAGTKQVVKVTFDVAPLAPTGNTPITFGNNPQPQDLNNTAGDSLQANYIAGVVNIQLGPTAASATIGGRVITAKGGSLGQTVVTLSDGSGRVRSAVTNSFGNFRFENVPAGASYIVTINSKRYTFAPQVVNLTDSMTDLKFTAAP